MKIYTTNLDGLYVQAYYDRNIRLWTVNKWEKNWEQVGESEYFHNRKQLIQEYNINTWKIEL